MKHALAIALLLAACGTKDSGPSATSCEGAAKASVEALVKRAKDRLASDKLPDQLRATLQQRTQKLDEIRPRFVAVITNRCTDDKWPADVVRCYSASSSVEEMRACRAKLAAPLQQKLVAEEMSLMSGAMGPPGFAGGSAMEPARMMPDAAEIETRLAKLDTSISDAEAQLAAATTAAARTAAQERLEKLRRNADRMRQQLERAKAMGSAGSGN